jgi:pimeloyl-ACP methyl ester carboxylesterase
MQILFELRYPTRWYTKLFMAALAIVFFAVLATSAIAGFLVYRIVKPQKSTSEISMASFPGRPDTVTFEVPGGLGTREGWFFPGLRGAPTIILCHGYGSSRGELLTIVSTLQDHQFNVFVFDFAAHGANPGKSTLGYTEVEELRAAMNTVAQRNDVDPNSFGLWGYNLGAYVALREAESDKRVRALILDSVYDVPAQMVKVGVQRNGLGTFPLMVRAAETSFEWLNYAQKNDAPLTKNLNKIAGVPTEWIAAADDPELGDITRKMFQKAPEPKEQVVIPRGDFAQMEDDEKRVYENRVVTFFLTKMPATGPGGR